METSRPPAEHVATNDPRPPQFLSGWRMIADTYGMTLPQAKAWYDQGAPIVMLGKTPVAEAWELWCWIREEYG